MFRSFRAVSRVRSFAPILAPLAALAFVPAALRAEPMEWTKWEMPRERSNFVAGFDRVGGRYVMYGGDTPLNGETWTLSFGPSPTWHLEGASVVRSQCKFAYDAAANRLFVFGGRDLSVLHATISQLDLETATWTEFEASGDLPPAAFYDNRAAAWDATRHRFALLGSQEMGDSRVFDPATGQWTARPDIGTVPRHVFTAIYDPVRDRFVVSTTQGMCAVTPEAFEWSVLTSESYGGAMVYDVARDRLLSVSYGRVWALSLAGPPVWTELGDDPPLEIPPNGEVVVLDTNADRLIVQDNSASGNATWAFTLSTNTWTRLVEESWWDPRYGHATVVVPPLNALVNFGHEFRTFTPDAVTRFQLDESGIGGVSATGTAPSSRQAAAAVYDPARARMVVHGGLYGVALYFDDLHSLTFGPSPTWSRLEPTGTPPGPRAHHEGVYDPVRDRMLVFGGNDGDVSYRDLWALSLPAPPARSAWTRLFDNGPPEQMPRLANASGAMVYDSRRDRVVVLGAEETSGLLRAWAGALEGAPVWVSIPGSIPGRRNYDAAYDPFNDRVLVFGGRDLSGTRELNDVVSLSLDTQVWSTLDVPNGPAPRHGHTFVHDAANGRFVVLGGREASGEEALSVWFLNDRGAQSSVPPSIVSHFALGSCQLVSRDRVRILADLPASGEVTFEIFDLQGRKLGSARETVASPGRREFTVILERDATPGLYFVRASQNDKRAQRKFIVVP